MNEPLVPEALQRLHRQVVALDGFHIADRQRDLFVAVAEPAFDELGLQLEVDGVEDDGAVELVVVPLHGDVAVLHGKVAGIFDLVDQLAVSSSVLQLTKLGHVTLAKPEFR